MRIIDIYELILYIFKKGKMSKNLSSTTVPIEALRVKVALRFDTF